MNRSLPSRTALVIGGGVVGLFTAWRLRDAGFAVTVIDRGGPRRSASWAGGGILAPLPPWQTEETVWPLAASSIEAYPAIVAELREQTGIDAEWMQSGMRVLDVQDTDAALAWSARTGWPVIRQPRDAKLTLHLPWVAQLRSPRLLRALRVYLGQRGVTWHIGEVERLEASGDRVHAVHTRGGGRCQGDLTVICAGAWSGGLAAGVGCSTPVTPVRGQMLLFETPPGLLAEILLAGERYLIPRADGRILVGSTLEEVGFDAGTTDQARAVLRDAAYRLLPALQGHVIGEQWSGLRPRARQAAPLIGRAGAFTNLFVNTGHYRAGITLAPASADLLRDAVERSG